MAEEGSGKIVLDESEVVALRTLVLKLIPKDDEKDQGLVTDLFYDLLDSNHVDAPIFILVIVKYIRART